MVWTLMIGEEEGVEVKVCVLAMPIRRIFDGVPAGNENKDVRA